MGMQDDRRDARGQFRKGVSGNPSGRPRKAVEVPKDMCHMLAEELERKVEFTDAGGKRRKGTHYEMICARIIAQAAEANAKDALTILERLDKLGAIELMRMFTKFDSELAATAARRFLAEHERTQRIDEVIRSAREEGKLPEGVLSLPADDSGPKEPDR